MISFTVTGEPVPWARARQRGKRYFTDEKVAAQKRKVRHRAIEEMLRSGSKMAELGTPLHVTLLFAFEGKKHGPHARRPDLDNLVKLVLDAMNGVVYQDDGCVSYIQAKKIVSSSAETIVTVEPA